MNSSLRLSCRTKGAGLRVKVIQPRYGARERAAVLRARRQGLGTGAKYAMIRLTTPAARAEAATLLTGHGRTLMFVVLPPFSRFRWHRKRVRADLSAAPGASFILPFGPGSGDRHHRPADRRQARPRAGASRWWSRTGPAATGSSPSMPSSAPTTTTRCCSCRPRYLRRPSLHHGEATLRRGRDLLPIANVTVIVAGAVDPSIAQLELAEGFRGARACQAGQLNVAAAAGNSDFMCRASSKTMTCTMAKIPYRDIMQAPNDLPKAASSFCRRRSRSCSR